MTDPTPTPTPRTPRGKRLSSRLVYRFVGISAIVLGVVYVVAQGFKDASTPLEPAPTQAQSEPFSIPGEHVATQSQSDSASPSIVSKPTVHRQLSVANTEPDLPLSAPSELTAVLAFESEMPHAQRLAAIHALPVQIDPQLSSALMAFVADPREPTALTRSQSLALRNDILNVLRRQEDFRGSLQQRLQELALDPSRDITLRDYALQHLAALNIEEPNSGWESHWNAIQSEDEGLSATAMLHLLSASRLTGNLSEPDVARLSEAALRLALDESTHPHSRATAFQVCGRLKIAEAREPALLIASSADASFPLRIAAIATLGDLSPSPDVIRLLQTMETGPEVRLRVPAASSLNRLNAQ